MEKRYAKAISTRFLIMSLILVLVTLSLSIQGAAAAENFPTREIEMVICYAPGGSTSLMPSVPM